MSDLHRQILNLSGHVEDDWTRAEKNCYMIGFRDARSAAAQLVKQSVRTPDEVNHTEARLRARVLADEKVRLSYPLGERECAAAQAMRTQEYRKQFKAFTQP